MFYLENVSHSLARASSVLFIVRNARPFPFPDCFRALFAKYLLYMRHYTKKESVKIMSFFSIPNDGYLVFLIFHFFILFFIFCSFSSSGLVLSTILTIVAWRGEEITIPTIISAGVCENGRNLLSLTFSIKAVCSIFSVKYKLISSYFTMLIVLYLL